MDPRSSQMIFIPRPTKLNDMHSIQFLINNMEGRLLGVEFLGLLYILSCFRVKANRSITEASSEIGSRVSWLDTDNPAEKIYCAMVIATGLPAFR